MTDWKVKSILGGISLLLFCIEVSCHDSLYDYMEVRLKGNGSAEIAISIHAADFLFDGAIDRSDTASRWFEALGETERANLISRANQALGETMTLLIPSKNAREKEEIPMPIIPSTASVDRVIRPGSLIATALLLETPEQIDICYRGEKRLMVVFNRPGQFPEVHDLASGTSETFLLHRPTRK
ncbi:MAG: hypothetical protein AAGC68_13600 [Verrucomicrobiota bacterium]